MNNDPAMVLLHGWGSSAAVWHSVVNHHHDTYDCYTPDLPGHGESGLDQTDLGPLVEQVLNSFNRPAVWLAWSLGALIAMKAAIMSPAHVQKLLVVSGTPAFVQTEGWVDAMPATTFDQFYDEYQANEIQARKRFLALQIHGDRHSRNVRSQLEAVASPAGNDIRWGLDMLRTQDIHEGLAQISCPIHCLYGANDSLIPASIGDTMSTVANVTVWPETGHVPFLSNPGLFMDWMNEVLNG
jgi:pimeloyl-[acyl-carrier protein] methyl ester esterase